MTLLARLFSLLLLLVGAGLSGCCPYPSSQEGAARARALSQEQLVSLYALMEQHRMAGQTEWGANRSPLPSEFARVGALYGDVGYLNRLVFGGCMDDKAALIFDGVDGSGPKKIRLVPGEGKAEELLWLEPRSAERSSSSTQVVPN